jgi:hypothetical protein
VVRPHPLQPAERHEEGFHCPDHAPAAREPALGRDPREDLVGQVLAQEDWEVVRFPAIAEEDDSWVVDTELGQSSFTQRRR